MQHAFHLQLNKVVMLECEFDPDHNITDDDLLSVVEHGWPTTHILYETSKIIQTCFL